MRNDPKFCYYDGTGEQQSADSLPEPKDSKVRNIIAYLNRAGILMEGNGTLEIGMGSYYVSVNHKAYIQIMTALPHGITNMVTYQTLEPRELVNETMSELKEWVGEENISKKLLGQTALMKLIYPDFDRNVFAHVIKKKLDVERFADVIEIGEGVFDEEVVLAGELPSFLREAIKGMNQN